MARGAGLGRAVVAAAMERFLEGRRAALQVRPGAEPGAAGWET